MNSDGSNNQSLKYQRVRPSGFRDIGIRNWDVWQRLDFFDIFFSKLNFFDSFVLFKVKYFLFPKLVK